MSSERYTGPLGRLTELTDVMTRFTDELRRQPPGSERRKQLDLGHARVKGERGNEIGRLMRSGHSGESLSGHLDREDPYRRGVPDGRDPEGRSGQEPRNPEPRTSTRGRTR